MLIFVCIFRVSFILYLLSLLFFFFIFLCLVFFFFFLMIRPPPSSTLFPYPPLFRSRDDSHQRASHLAPMNFARPVDRPRACQFACRSPRSTTHACRHDVQEERSVCKGMARSEEHTSELQSPCNLVCRLLLEKKNTTL